MLIGFLKFVADSSGFLSPILLNWVVLFMEDKSMDIRWGYVYALGLCGSTLVAALCNTHFNLLISELKLKVSISTLEEHMLFFKILIIFLKPSQNNCTKNAVFSQLPAVKKTPFLVQLEKFSALLI